MREHIKLLSLRLYGGATPEDRTKCYKAFTAFRQLYAPSISQLNYIDDDGRAVFCLAVLVTGSYEIGFYTSAWQTLCNQFELEVLPADEVITTFEDVFK